MSDFEVDLSSEEREVFLNESRDQIDEAEQILLEMEAAGLYTIAAKHKIQALTLLTVSDSLVTSEQDDAKKRESSYTDMMEIALDTVIAE